MSDASSSDILVQRLSELERTKAEAFAESRKRKLQLRALQQELEGLRTEREGWLKEREALQSSPTEWQRKAEELQRQIRSRDHRDAWREVIGAELAEKVPIEDVWNKLKYEPGDQVPTVDQIKEQAKAAHDAAPYLFRNGRENGQAAPVGAQQTSGGAGRGALSVPLDVSRGDRDTGIGRMVVRNSDLRNPSFMMSHTRELAEASQKGTLTILPD